jgi:methionine sulfoxide reductase heme-binding subunit
VLGLIYAIVWGSLGIKDEPTLFLVRLTMTLTSFPLTSKAIGSRAWRLLHTVGMYYDWVIFAAGFAARLGKEWVYLVAMALMAISLLIRILGRRKSRVQISAN